MGISNKIERSWLCDGCNQFKADNFSVEGNLPRDIDLNSVPTGWHVVKLNVPNCMPYELLLCRECSYKIKGNSFKEILNSYSRLLNQDRPILTVDALVKDHDAKILLIKRKNPPHGWALPGGLMDKGETLRDAVVRELKEETGIISTSETIELMSMFSDPKRDPRFHAVSAAFYIPTWEGTAKAADDAKEVGWFSLKEIEDMDIAFDHKEIIKIFEKEYL